MFSIIIITYFIMTSSLHISNTFLKIAHRGYSEHYKDNSIISFNKAVENKFDMIETDIQLSKNKDVVLYHDIHIDNNYICDINTVDLVKKHDIVTLDDFFTQFINLNKNIKINFDLKGNDDLLAYKLIQTFIKYNTDTSQIYISSFNRNILTKINHYKSLYSMNYKIGFITSNVFTYEEEDILLKNINFFVMDYTILTHNTINYCHSKDIKVFTYTNKNIYTYDIITRYNIDGIYSDCKFPDINQI